MRMGFRPVYQTYVDMVIEHLGGKSFRETAEEELLARFLKTVLAFPLEQGEARTEKGQDNFP